MRRHPPHSSRPAASGPFCVRRKFSARRAAGHSLAQPRINRTILVHQAAPSSICSPFWFESTQRSRQNAAKENFKRLFQGSSASFRSLGLVFAFSRYQRLIRARNPGPAWDCLVSKEVNIYP
ncbi:hypothetical protein C4K24_0387 [Pseudomonas chlororaphis subsp. aurantiaca]|nr:hypothetical protein C4K24_0387 [Pseudomonas chlororaphis subsp. aurantiaca]